MKLYLDDVARIVETMRGHTTGDVTIATEDYIVEDVEELANLGKQRIHELDIEMTEPCLISVSLAPGSATIRSPDSSPATRGIVAEIEEVLRARKRSVFFQPRRKTDRAGRSEARDYSTILLRDKTAPGFLGRRKDDIYLILIGAALGAGLDRLVTEL